MPDSTYPQLNPDALEFRLHLVNKCLNHIHYAKLAISSIDEDWALDATATLEDGEEEVTRYRDRELVS